MRQAGVILAVVRQIALAARHVRCQSAGPGPTPTRYVANVKRSGGRYIRYATRRHGARAFGGSMANKRLEGPSWSWRAPRKVRRTMAYLDLLKLTQHHGSRAISTGSNSFAGPHGRLAPLCSRSSQRARCALPSIVPPAVAGQRRALDSALWMLDDPRRGRARHHVPSATGLVGGEYFNAGTPASSSLRVLYLPSSQTNILYAPLRGC